MEKIEKTIKYTQLFNLYGVLLTDTQKDIFNDYFLLDLSLSEISENRSISRAAVEDALNKAIRKLDQYESELHLLEKNTNIRSKIQQLREKTTDKEVLNILDELMEDVNNGIWKFDRETFKNL